MFRLNLFILSEIANNLESVCVKDWCEYWVFDNEYNYGADIDVKAYRQQQWLDEMNANCEEYLPYEEDFDIDFSLDEDNDFDNMDIPF